MPDGPPADTPAPFPARLRELREAAGLSQSQLAERAGVRQASVSKYETGAREPPLSIAGRLAAALGCRLDDLVRAAPGEP